MLCAAKGFQFHKGTIKTYILHSIKKRNPNFNSIKVRLKHNGDIYNEMVDNYFNSIKVRLKHVGRDIVLERKLFQFHKGTIKTMFLCKSRINSSTFQFHKGTIKTAFYCVKLCNLRHFNSIKVRLKHIVSK